MKITSRDVGVAALTAMLTLLTNLLAMSQGYRPACPVQTRSSLIEFIDSANTTALPPQAKCEPCPTCKPYIGFNVTRTVPNSNLKEAQLWNFPAVGGMLFNASNETAWIERRAKMHPKITSQGSLVPRGTLTFPIRDTVNDKQVLMNVETFCNANTFLYDQTRQYMRQSFMGVQSQLLPADTFALADLMWRIKPDLLIEVGTNTGASAMFYAMYMKTYNPDAIVVTLDVSNVRHWAGESSGRSLCLGCSYNSATEVPLWHDGTIKFIQGDIVTNQTVRDKVEAYVKKAKVVMAIEDATHGTDTINRMRVIAKYVTPGSYMQVQDGADHDGVRTSIARFMKEDQENAKEWVTDRRWEQYAICSKHVNGYLRRL